MGGHGLGENSNKSQIGAKLVFIFSSNYICLTRNFVFLQCPEKNYVLFFQSFIESRTEL